MPKVRRRWLFRRAVVSFGPRIVLPVCLWLGLDAGLWLTGCARRDVPDVPLTTEEVEVGRFGSWSSLPAPTEPRNIILLTLDTTRQDRLSCYGFPKPTTPRCDQIASEGVLFERAISPAPVTLPAHASIMTGLYPYQHGVRNNGTYILPDSFQTLAEMLQERDYRTGAILGGFPLDHRFGLAQGFDHYDDEFPPQSRRRESDTAQRPASEVTRLALAWLDQAGAKDRTRSFFLWAHYFDPHSPYAPPEPFADRFPGDPYSGEVASMDAAIGGLVDGLKSRGLLEQSVLLLVGDHGESLGEHQEATHSYFVYGATQDVPMILRLPQSGDFRDKVWRGRRISELAGQVDCLPTLLNAIGWEERERPLCAGLSLLPVIEGKAKGHRWVYLETLVPRLEYNFSDLRGLQTLRWKYIRAPQPELYDLSQDPKELHNLAGTNRRVAEAMDADLSTALKADIGDDAGQVAMDRETIETLRSLGYMAGARTQETEGPLPDPKRMIGVFARVDAARSLVAEHKTAAALARIDSVLSQQPDNGTALRIRASCLVRLGRGGEAAALYDSLLAGCRHCPDELELRIDRAGAALVDGKIADAKERIRTLLQTYPNEPGLRLLLGKAHEAAKEIPQARREFREEIRLHPEEPGNYVALGNLELSAGDRTAAESAYREALERNPEMADALARLGEVLIETGRMEAGAGYVDQALRADPLHPEALFRKAWLLRKEKRDAEALPYYRKALEQQPDDPRILYNLGNLLMSQGNATEAMRLFLHAIEVGPVNQGLLVNLGVLYAQGGNIKAAIEQWEKAITMDPQSAQVPSIRQNMERARRTQIAGKPGG